MKGTNCARSAQVDLLTRFVRRVRDLRDPLIVAGDFNVGNVPERRKTLFGSISARWTEAGPVHDALGEAQTLGMAMSNDATSSKHRAKDWQFYASGGAASLTVADIAVPFGHDRSGSMLSDHIGYTASFRMADVRTPVRLKT